MNNIWSILWIFCGLLFGIYFSITYAKKYLDNNVERLGWFAMSALFIIFETILFPFLLAMAIITGLLFLIYILSEKLEGK